MFKIFLTTFLLVLLACVKADEGGRTNIDDSSKILPHLGRLEDLVEEIKDEINRFFLQADDPALWYERNSELLEQNKVLLDVLKENFTSTMTIVNYTLAFRDMDEHPPLQSEMARAAANGQRLAALSARAAESERALQAAQQRLAEEAAPQREGDDALKAAGARLQALRTDADALIQREGQLEFQLSALRDRLQALKLRAEKIFKEELIATETFAQVKIRTSATENAIKQAQLEIQQLKAGNHTAATASGTATATVTATPSVNFIKSVKTASGRGKRIRLVLLSD